MNSYSILIKKHKKTLVTIDQFIIEPNKINVLFGESGIGKSLISQSLFGLLDEHDFQIQINQHSYSHYKRQKEVKQYLKNGFFVFQEPSTHLNPLMKIEDQLNEGEIQDASRNDFILESLWNTTSYKTLLDIYPRSYRPSGGEKQRFLLAMALKKQAIKKESFFVFDEPSGSLDENTRNLFFTHLLTEFIKRPFTILLITHDYSLIEFFNGYLEIQKSIRYSQLVKIKGKLFQNQFERQDVSDFYERFEGLFEDKIDGRKLSLLKVEPTFKMFNQSYQFIQEGQVKPLRVQAGCISYLKAKSGIGKTSLLKAILGIIPSHGLNLELGKELHFNSDSPIDLWQTHIWGKEIGMVFQNADEALDQNATISETFRSLIYPKKLSDSHLLIELKQIFKDIDLPFLSKKIKHLSGGQKQRINMLRTLHLNTPVIFLDEPFTGVDLYNMGRILSIMKRVLDSGKGILLVSHDESLFDRLIPEHNVWQLETQ